MFKYLLVKAAEEERLRKHAEEEAARQKALEEERLRKDAEGSVVKTVEVRFPHVDGHQQGVC